MNRTIFISILFFLFIQSLFAQVDREGPTEGESIEIRNARNVLYGKLLDQQTGKGVPAASMQLYIVLESGKDSLIRTKISETNGDFRFTDLPPGRNMKLLVSATGFKPFQQVVFFGNEQEGDRRQEGNVQKDMGNITMETDIQQLGGVTIVATRPTLELGIDRRVYNVDKSITTTGGTAIDVMRNIPAVSVDIDGNVELRNSNPQIFVDGRPTILTLDQIPADNIDRVEIITNPSAKFDAASSAGIINVILKKNKRLGLNGVITAGAGAPDVLNGNLNLNLREGKLNYFLSAGYNRSGGLARGETTRENFVNGVTEDYFNQLTKNDRMRAFTSFRFGIDLYADNRNTIGISQNISNGKFSNDETQSQQYLNRDKILEYYGERFAEGQFRFNRYGTRLNYKHSFPEEGKELTADINYNYGPRSENSRIRNAFYNPDGTEYEPAAIVRNDGASDNDQVTFQVDFTDPLKNEGKIEMGFRSYYNKFSSYFNAFAMDNGQEVKLPLSNNYVYTEKINAFYVTWSGKKKSISYQFGLRTELSDFDGELLDSAYRFGYTFPDGLKNIWDALFPSAFFTKQLNETDQLQVNYTRRIRRPGFWQLNPFIDINDPANLQQGNPQLRPEFINSFELNYSKDYRGGNFLGVIYFRNNPDDITRYSDTITAAQYAQLNNAAVDPNAILNTFINASTTNRYGAEFTLQHKIGQHFELTPSVDLQYRTVKARVKDLDLSNEGFSWEAKLVSSYKISTKKEKSFFNNLGFQLMGEYESREVIPQGLRDPQYSMDVAVRKDFFKNNKGSLTLAVNDVFNSHRFGTTYDTETFYQQSYRRRNVRNFRVTFTYKFGDAKFTLSRRGGDRNGGDED